MHAEMFCACAGSVCCGLFLITHTLLVSDLLFLLLSNHNHHVDYFVAIGDLHCEGKEENKTKSIGVITRLS